MEHASAYSDNIFRQQHPHFQASVLSLLMAQAQGTLRQGAGAGLQQDCAGSPSGRHHHYQPYEPLLPRAFWQHSPTLRHGQDASVNNSSSLSGARGRHKHICQNGRLREAHKGMPVREQFTKALC